MYTRNEKIVPIAIENEMKNSFMDYSMSVIVSRALPDVRDGLKPVHRRILYTMHELGLVHNRGFRKCAAVVGDTMGKYHPHGDSAIYDTLVRLAQPWNMRYPLVQGQGNFGSVDGDSPAAMRYTEARMAAITAEMLGDIEKQTVDMTANYDGRLQEPMVLPSAIPNLLVNGSYGIAVGMATSCPPHNLTEVCDAVVHLIDHPEATTRDLLKFVKGPDFPTGGIIMGRESIVQAYATGRGKFLVRAKAEIEELRGDRFRIVVTEIPYQLNKSSLLERIAELVRSGKLEEISDLRDESDKRGMRIIIELKRDAQPQKALNRLFKFTPLQSTFGVQLLALVNNEPRILPLKRLLLIFLEHRIEIVVRRARFELRQAQARAHILEGLLIALDHLDEVIRTIRESPNVETARTRLMEGFTLTETQAQAILDMQLRRLTALERQKLLDEYEGLLKQIAYLEDLLASPLRQRAVIREELLALQESYADPRRTHIEHQAGDELDEEDFVTEERVLIPITQRGYIKRMPTKVYKAQGRGGRGVIGMTTRDEDAIVYLLAANTLDTLLFFTDHGKVYQERVYQIPQADRTAKGSLIAGILALNPSERVTAVVAVRTFDERHFLTMVTRQGWIKRMALSEFVTVRPSGLIAITLEDNDVLGWARLTQGHDDVILVTEQGQGIRFNEQEVRPMGRNARGVTSMRLAPQDNVASMEVVEPGGDLFIVSENGYGRRTALEEFGTQGRGGKGVRAYNVTAKTGPVTAARVVRPGDEITLISQNGIVIRTRVANIPQMGRYSQGVQLIDLKEGDRVASVARLPEEAAENNGAAAATNGIKEDVVPPPAAVEA